MSVILKPAMDLKTEIGKVLIKFQTSLMYGFSETGVLMVTRTNLPEGVEGFPSIPQMRIVLYRLKQSPQVF